MLQHLYFDSAFTVNYSANNLNLTEYPFKLILKKGMGGVLNGPKLFYCVQKKIDQSCKNVIELKPKTINESSKRRIRGFIVVIVNRQFKKFHYL